MMTVAERYRYIKDDVISAAEYYGRNPDEITLVAISKGSSWQEASAAYQAGCRDFGESRVQETLLKISEAPQDISWHFVGHLQKNKISKVLGRCVLIHSVDTFELAAKISELSARAAIKTSILLEVNISGETTKQGMDKDHWRRCFEALLDLPAIQVKGLMTMAPLTQDQSVVRRCFAGLREFRDELVEKNGLHADSLKQLSMGMSNDYRLAIAEGATLLRVGTAIFSK